jgi:hypothetical protein
LSDGIGGDSGPRGWGGAIQAVGRGRRDAEDDAVAVLDLERSRLARGAVLGRDAEGATAEGMEGIHDGDGQGRLVLTLLTARGIKEIPR